MQYWGCVLNHDRLNETEDEFRALQAQLDQELDEISSIRQYQLERGSNNQHLHYQINIKSYMKTEQPLAIARELVGHRCNWTLMPTNAIKTMDKGGYSIKKHTREAGPWIYPMTDTMVDELINMELKAQLPDLYPEQQQVLDLILSDTSDRLYFHLYDHLGGWGKETLGNTLELKHDAVNMTACINTSDLAFMLSEKLKPAMRMQKLIIVIDIPKAFDYKCVPSLCVLIEQLKNKKLASGKYKSRLVKLKYSPTVVVTTNFHPGTFSKYFTEQRMYAIDLREQYPHMVQMAD